MSTATRTPEELQDLRQRARAADLDGDPILVKVVDPACPAHGEQAELLYVNDDGTFLVRDEHGDEHTAVKEIEGA